MPDRRGAGRQVLAGMPYIFSGDRATPAAEALGVPERTATDRRAPLAGGGLITRPGIIHGGGHAGRVGPETGAGGARPPGQGWRLGASSAWWAEAQINFSRPSRAWGRSVLLVRELGGAGRLPEAKERIGQLPSAARGFQALPGPRPPAGSPGPPRGRRLSGCPSRAAEEVRSCSASPPLGEPGARCGVSAGQAAGDSGQELPPQPWGETHGEAGERCLVTPRGGAFG